MYGTVLVVYEGSYNFPRMVVLSMNTYRMNLQKDRKELS